MDDEFGDDVEFDFDNDFFQDEMVGGVGLGLSADDGTDGALGDGEPPNKRQRQSLDEYASAASHFSTDGVAGAAGIGPEDVPPHIENLQLYLPNVAPTAAPVVVNLLAQATIPVGPDLRKLSCAARNVEFMPKSRNASATMRLQDPSAVVTIRSSGSMTIIGAASISEARQAAELAARIVRKALDLDFQAFMFRVRSISARFNTRSPIRINDLAAFEFDRSAHRGVAGVHCSYEPDRFNGCVVKLTGSAEDNKWVVTCLVFVTGKITIMGARSMDELRFAFDALVPILAKYVEPADTATSIE